MSFFSTSRERACAENGRWLMSENYSLFYQQYVFMYARTVWLRAVNQAIKSSFTTLISEVAAEIKLSVGCRRTHSNTTKLIEIASFTNRNNIQYYSQQYNRYLLNRYVTPREWDTIICSNRFSGAFKLPDFRCITNNGIILFWDSRCDICFSAEANIRRNMLISEKTHILSLFTDWRLSWTLHEYITSSLS